MLQRLYIHNFRCLENFDLSLKEMSSALLIGKNGAGKSTTGFVLEVLQCISRGINRVGQLIKHSDFSWGRSDVPMRFEIEVLLDDIVYRYVLVLELPEGFKEVRVSEEQLLAGGVQVYYRSIAQVTLQRNTKDIESKFLLDWHLIALPVIQVQSETDPLHIFKTWLSRMLILAPVPSRMSGQSSSETLEPKKDGSNFGDWFSGVLGSYPSAYTQIYNYLRNVMPDVKDIQNPLIGKNFKSMNICFEVDKAKLRLEFDDLSDGEKCFFLCALALAASKEYGPLFCFWDEPDNYLSLGEVGQFIIELQSVFENGSQVLITSHHQEAIRRFSHENTLVLLRKSHLAPTEVRKLSDIYETGELTGDLVDALLCGEI